MCIKYNVPVKVFDLDFFPLSEEDEVVAQVCEEGSMPINVVLSIVTDSVEGYLDHFFGLLLFLMIACTKDQVFRLVCLMKLLAQLIGGIC